MRSKFFTLIMLTGISSAAIFGGCGNGGGGDGGGGSGGLSYTGETAPAEINQDNKVRDAL